MTLRTAVILFCPWSGKIINWLNRITDWSKSPAPGGTFRIIAKLFFDENVCPDH